MKKMMMTLMALVVAMIIVVPVMATESENSRTEYQQGQLELCEKEMNEGYSLTTHDLKVHLGDDGYHYTTGLLDLTSEHYNIKLYYTKENQNGYGSLYFKDRTFITSFEDFYAETNIIN
jgi:competence protein ComGC